MKMRRSKHAQTRESTNGVHERTFQSDAFIAGGFGRYILFLQPDDDAEFSPGGKGSIFFKMVASSSDAEI